MIDKVNIVDRFKLLVLFFEIPWSDFPSRDFILCETLQPVRLDMINCYTELVILKSAPLMSSTVPTETSISDCLVSYQVKVPPHSLQNPLIIPGDDLNVLNEEGDIEYDFKPSAVSHMKSLIQTVVAVNTMAPVCFLH